MIALLVLTAAPLFAQKQAPLAPVRDSLGQTLGPVRIEGQVVRPGDRDMVPVPNIKVMLHRVGPDRAAPMDSTRSDSRGRYAFTFTRTGDSTAIYFASASYSGIAYFTPPIADTLVRGENAEITVYDTTSAGIRIGVRGHHVVVSAVNANAERSVTEVYELANDSSVTRIAEDTSFNHPVWTALVPARGTDFRVSQGDIPAGAVAFRNAHVSVFAPIAPGLAQLAFTYNLPASAFPLTIPVEQPTQIFEVLVEDERGKVTGAKLKERDPVLLERRSFRRFLADDVPENAVSLIDLPAEVHSTVDKKFLVALTVLIGAAMIGALAVALRRR